MRNFDTLPGYVIKGVELLTEDLKDGTYPFWKVLEILRAEKTRATRLLDPRRNLTPGNQAHVVRAVTILEEVIAAFEDRTETEPTSKWLAGGRMDLPDASCTAELCQVVEDRVGEDSLLREVWWEKGRWDSKRELSAGEVKAMKWDIKVMETDMAREFCRKALGAKSYSEFLNLAAYWRRIWTGKNLSSWEIWAKARNFLTKKALERFRDQCLTLHPALWEEKPLAFEAVPPAPGDPAWRWEAFLALEEAAAARESEEDVFSPSLKDRLESIQGIGEARAQALADALGDRVFDVSMEDLLEVDGIGPVTAYKVFGGELEVGRFREAWEPSERFLTSSPLGETKSLLDDPEELGELLGDSRGSRATARRTSMSEMEEWLAWRE